MNPPSVASKPKLPSYLLNGDKHTTQKSSTLRRTSVNGKEREALTASIKSSHNRRQPIDLSVADPSLLNGRDSDSPAPTDEELESDVALDIPSRDSRDEAPETPLPSSTRPASPYTLNPPIDFDGLSWPSKRPLSTEKLHD